MKKATLSLTTLAALTVATVALGDEPNRTEGPTPTPSSSGAAQSGTPQAAAQKGSPPSAASMPCPSTVGTTTITQAEVTPAPLVSPPPPHDTITVKQSVRPNRALLYTGTSMLVGSYATTAAVTAVRDVRDGNGDQSLYIPVAGPWLHLKNTSESPLNTALIAGAGAFQGTGLVLGVMSLIVPERIPAATIQAGGVKVHITATTPGKGAAGIGAFGQF